MRGAASRVRDARSRARDSLSETMHSCTRSMTRRMLGTLAAFLVVKAVSRRSRRGEILVDYTHYDWLDLAPGASPSRIDAAYTKLLERFGYGTTDAGQDLSGMVRLIHAAYETLSDPQARSAYDARLAQEAAMADAELKAALDREAVRPSRQLQE